MYVKKARGCCTVINRSRIYISLSSACCQGVWIKRILANYGVHLEDPIPIKCHNKSCLAIAKNHVLHNRTKHIGVKFHFIRELVNDGIIQLDYCNTEEQIVDIFTKCLDAKKQYKFKSLLGVYNLQSRRSMLE